MGNFKKAIIFLLTFSAYAGLHCLRQGWSYSKPELQKALDISQAQLGLVDTLYLILYSVGMATIGNLTSNINLRFYVSVGMILAIIFYSSFSIVYLLTNTFSYVFLIIAMSLNGFFQSTGWPGVMGIMGNWFGKGKRGLLMGLWGINANIGNIIGSVMCNIIQQDMHWGWTSNFLFTGGFALIIAILILIFIRQRPPKASGSESDQDNLQLDHSVISEAQTQEKAVNQSILPSSENQQEINNRTNITVLSALCLPRVPFYVVGYALMKGCIYGLLFWLPTYLAQIGLEHEKGFISSMVDIGSFIGGVFVGILGDKYSYRALFLSPFLLLGAVTMFIVSFALTDIAWTYYTAMFFIGLFTGGPYNIVGSAITIDLGEQAGKKNIGKVSALIEGSGAIFSAFSQLIISVIPFEYIFYLFSGQCLIACLALFPLFLRDLKEWKLKRKSNKAKIEMDSQ